MIYRWLQTLTLIKPYFYPLIWIWASTTEKVRPRWVGKTLGHLTMVVQTTNTLTLPLPKGGLADAPKGFSLTTFEKQIS